MSKEVEALDRAIASIDRLQATLLDFIVELDRMPPRAPEIRNDIVYTITGEQIPIRRPTLKGYRFDR